MRRSPSRFGVAFLGLVAISSAKSPASASECPQATLSDYLTSITRCWLGGVSLSDFTGFSRSIRAQDILVTPWGHGGSRDRDHAFGFRFESPVAVGVGPDGVRPRIGIEFEFRATRALIYGLNSEYDFSIDANVGDGLTTHYYWTTEGYAVYAGPGSCHVRSGLDGSNDFQIGSVRYRIGQGRMGLSLCRATRPLAATLDIGVLAVESAEVDPLVRLHSFDVSYEVLTTPEPSTSILLASALLLLPVGRYLKLRKR